MEESRSVNDLKKGESGYVKSFKNLDCACKLLTLGLLPKSKVTMIRKSPMGDAYYLKLNNHQIAVRQSEAYSIILED